MLALMATKPFSESLNLDSSGSCLESDLHLCEQCVLTHSDLTGHSGAVSVRVAKARMRRFYTGFVRVEIQWRGKPSTELKMLAVFLYINSCSVHQYSCTSGGADPRELQLSLQTAFIICNCSSGAGRSFSLKGTLVAYMGRKIK